MGLASPASVQSAPTPGASGIPGPCCLSPQGSVHTGNKHENVWFGGATETSLTHWEAAMAGLGPQGACAWNTPPTALGVAPAWGPGCPALTAPTCASACGLRLGFWTCVLGCWLLHQYGVRGSKKVTANTGLKNANMYQRTL